MANLERKNGLTIASRSSSEFVAFFAYISQTNPPTRDMQRVLTRKAARDEGVEIDDDVSLSTLEDRVKRARTGRENLDACASWPVCPLTGEPIREAAVTETMSLYEHRAIAEHLRNPENLVDPATGQRLKTFECIQVTRLHLVTLLKEKTGTERTPLHNWFRELFERRYAERNARSMDASAVRAVFDIWRRMARFPGDAISVAREELCDLFQTPDSRSENAGRFLANDDAVRILSAIPEIGSLLQRSWATNLFVAQLSNPEISNIEPFTSRGVGSHGFCYFGSHANGASRGELILRNGAAICLFKESGNISP